MQAGSASSGTEESADERTDAGGPSAKGAAGSADEGDSPVRPNTHLSLLDQHHELKRLVEGLSFNDIFKVYFICLQFFSLAQPKRRQI